MSVCSGFVEKIPTASVPQIPHVRWTEIAPTGSSIRIRSKKITEPTTRPPATRPMMIADSGVITSAPAVMPTRPARMPFSDIERSGLEDTIGGDEHRRDAARREAARHVVTSASEVSSGSAESTEPPLKPNQPSQSRKTPIAASGMLLPGIGS